MIERIANVNPHKNDLIVDGELIVSMTEACRWFDIPYKTAWNKRYRKGESWEVIFNLED